MIKPVLDEDINDIIDKKKEYNRNYYLNHKSERKDLYSQQKDNKKEYYKLNKDKILKQRKEAYSQDKQKYLNRVKDAQKREKLIKQNTIDIQKVMEIPQINFIDKDGIVCKLSNCEIKIKFIKV